MRICLFSAFLIILSSSLQLSHNTIDLINGRYVLVGSFMDLNNGPTITQIKLQAPSIIISGCQMIFNQYVASRGRFKIVNVPQWSIMPFGCSDATKDDKLVAALNSAVSYLPDENANFNFKDSKGNIVLTIHMQWYHL